VNLLFVFALFLWFDAEEQEASPSLGESFKKNDVVSAKTLKLRLNKPALREYNTGIEAFLHKDVAAAAEHFKVTISNAPNFAAAHNNLGVCYMSQNNQPLALDAFRSAITLDSALPEPHSNMAYLLLDSRLPAEAESEARIALKLNPKSGAARYLLGLSLIRQHGYTPEALAQMKKASDVVPNAKRWIERFDNAAAMVH
jgi:Flp pilus assembly protein TadD